MNRAPVALDRDWVSRGGVVEEGLAVGRPTGWTELAFLCMSRIIWFRELIVFLWSLISSSFLCSRSFVWSKSF